MLKKFRLFTLEDALAHANAAGEAHPLGRTVRRIRGSTSVRAARWRSSWVLVEDFDVSKTKLARFSAFRQLGSFLPGPHPPSRNHSIHTFNSFEYLVKMLGIRNLHDKI